MRTFSGGATRDDIDSKLDYARALDPKVLKRYLEYLRSHRKQSDGNMRAFDNWKKGIPKDEYLSSLLRHVHDVWTKNQYADEPIDIEESLCAIIFNAKGYLFEVLRDKVLQEKKRPAGFVRTYPGSDSIAPERDEKDVVAI